MIKAVTFDLWNTLLSDRDYAEWRIGYLSSVLRENNLFKRLDETMEAYKQTNNYANEVPQRENYRNISADERVSYMLRRLQVELPADMKLKITKEFEEVILLDPPLLAEGAKETLEALHGKYRIRLVSNSGFSPGRVLREVLRRADVLRLFSSTVFSDEVNYMKPNTIIFQTALRELQVNPSEAVHIGDLLDTDVAGAKGAGMKAIWLNLKEEPLPEIYKPDQVVRTLPQLMEVIGQIAA